MSAHWIGGLLDASDSAGHAIG